MWKIRAWTYSACFHCANICRAKFIICLLLYKLANSNYISESETKHSEASLEMILNGTTFHQVTEFQTNRPLKILSLRGKYDSEVKVKNNSEYRTKIYLDRKRSCFLVLNGENILSSAWKTRIYPRDKNHWELTERRMITTKHLLVQAQRFMRNWSATTILSWVTNLTTHKKSSLTFGLFSGEFRNIAICKLKLRLVNAIKYKYYSRRLCKLALYILNIFVNFANASKAKQIN